MNKQQIIGLGGLLLSLTAACLGVAGETAPAGPASGQALAKKPVDVGEMREWLSQRNLERKHLGLPGSNLPKTHSAAVHPRSRAAQLPPPAEAVPDDVAGTGHGTPVLHLGRGPDGRIHVRYLLKEDGPDQLQVESAEGYSAPVADAAKLNRLTPHGKRVWMAGSSLRTPSAPRWVKPSLDPKIKDDDQ